MNFQIEWNIYLIEWDNLWVAVFSPGIHGNFLSDDGNLIMENKS
jgi:hypothetical protein